MGGLLCKQRSRSRPHHSAQSRGKKLHRVDCLLRGPCLLCFIVHGEHPNTKAASPDLPAAQDCARLLLLCPGELSAWQEGPRCGGVLRDPGLLCTADTMVCKRKNCGENQQTLTPCKQPRCAPSREQSHSGDLSSHPTGETAQRHCEDLPPCCSRESEPYYENPSLCSSGDFVQPPTEEPSLCAFREIAELLSVDPSSFSSREAAPPHFEDLSQTSGEHTQSPPAVPIRPFSEIVAPSCSYGTKLHCQRKWQSTGDPAPSSTKHHVRCLPGNMSQNSVVEKQLQSLTGDVAPSFSEGQDHHCYGRIQCTGEGQITGNLGLFCTGECTQRLPRDPEIQHTIVQVKPVNLEPLHLGTEDGGQAFENEYVGNRISSCSTMSLNRTPSPLAAPSYVELPSTDCNQALSPKVEGEMFMLCEPLHINQLPPSLLLKIFSHLSLNERCLSASLVCKYWRDLCLDFQFWKQLDLSSRQQVKDGILEKISSRCRNITEINISDCLNVTDVGICKLKVHVGNQDRLTDEALHQLGSSCKDLRDIHFGQCYKISDEGLVVIAKGCPKLQKIYMQENKLVTNRSVEAFAEYCRELQYVGFMGCSVTSDGVIHLTNLKSLSSLDLRNITELDNQTVVEIVKKCQNLTSLNLCLNRNIDDRCVEVIAKEGRRLKELYLVTCKITDYALISIGRYSSTIETVDVGWCKEITDQGATLIAQSSKSIRYLGLMRCDQVNEATVEQLVQQYPHITFSTVLQDCKRTLERAYQMGWTPNPSSVS
ncbi:F-box/LRR-repeat protein 17 isoform X2 [Pyxicephalus adspersus]|uniref:F-box/LRR-repeat protein 17 isoform X2 n=1 Tax=Pyxicephalus adspersus TaxID=30357 RepID=UPI003B5A675E